MSEISCGFVRPAMAHTLNPPHDITIRKRDSNVEAAAGNYRIIPIEFPWGGKKKRMKRTRTVYQFFSLFFRYRRASRAFCLNHTHCCGTTCEDFVTGKYENMALPFRRSTRPMQIETRSKLNEHACYPGLRTRKWRK